MRLSQEDKEAKAFASLTSIGVRRHETVKQEVNFLETFLWVLFLLVVALAAVILMQVLGIKLF